MPNYMIAYYTGKKPETPEAGQAQYAKWKAWIAGLGEAVVNSGTPLTNSMTVTAQGVTEGGQLTGYAVIQAESIEAALQMAKGDPFLEMGTIEVAEMMEMN